MFGKHNIRFTCSKGIMPPKQTHSNLKFTTDLKFITLIMTNLQVFPIVDLTIKESQKNKIWENEWMKYGRDYFLRHQSILLFQLPWLYISISIICISSQRIIKCRNLQYSIIIFYQPWENMDIQNIYW